MNNSKTKPMYYMLTESFAENHKILVDLIQKACDVESIYFLGSTITTSRTETLFMTNTLSCNRINHYYLLVLINKQYRHHEVQDIIEGNCKHYIPVTVIVLYKEEFEQWLIQGHAFACTVYNQAVMLYRKVAETPKLQPVAKEITPEEKNSVYTSALNKVEGFLAGADLHRIRKENRLCAFMLHQAAEQALHALLELRTGLGVVTHNVEKLLRYSCMVCYKLPLVFTNNEKDMQLLRLLQQAYTGARYSADYAPGAEDLLLLTGKVRQIAKLLKTTGNK